jgi:hypothetical protein
MNIHYKVKQRKTSIILFEAAQCFQKFVMVQSDYLTIYVYTYTMGTLYSTKFSEDLINKSWFYKDDHKVYYFILPK